jgi:hypothetical protein
MWASLNNSYLRNSFVDYQMDYHLLQALCETLMSWPSWNTGRISWPEQMCDVLVLRTLRASL